MFNFQKLEVYQIAKAFHKDIRSFLKSNSIIDKYARDQLIRASMSIVLNIAEGSGRFSNADKRNFYIIARSSIFECIALFEILKEEKLLEEKLYNQFYSNSERISKILFVLIQNLGLTS